MQVLVLQSVKLKCLTGGETVTDYAAVSDRPYDCLW